MKTEKDFLEYLTTIKNIASQEGFDSLDETYVAHLRARFFGEAVVIGHTERIRLREMKPDDLEKIYGFEDAETEPVLQSFLKESKEASKEHLSAYIQQMYPFYDYGIWTAELCSTGEMIGICGLGQMEADGELAVDLGYYICPKYRRKGLASECIKIALDYAENYLELPVIYAVTKKENQISAHILQKFGFQVIKSDETILFAKTMGSV